MNNELVELIVQLYEKNWGVKDHGLARAVVAMCMEEAARVLENDCHDDMTRAEEAAAIRAMKDKE